VLTGKTCTQVLLIAWGLALANAISEGHVTSWTITAMVVIAGALRRY
jgi:hypothetical protein